MKPLEWVNDDPSQSKLLIRSACLAFLIEAILLTAIGWHEHWLAHPKKVDPFDDSHFIEAQMFQIPSEAHLVEEKKSHLPPPPKHEITLNKEPEKGKATQTDQNKMEEQNQTESGHELAATHGPVVLYAPSPVIPPYLQNQEFKTSIVIDFYITAQGNVSPRLVTSSGNDELDAIALNAVKKWQFRPAEQDHKPIDAKVRLRIVFKVE